MSAVAPKPTALDLVKRNENALPTEARERWAAEQLVTIWTTVCEGASFGEFAMFISLAARHKLDPLAHEIWFSKSKTGKVMIMVGRDGLLAVARRSGDFVTVRGDVHRANDHFKIIHEANGTEIVEHSYEGGIKERGEVLGSWAQVLRKDGRLTNFTYCPADEYGPWDRISQKSAMMQKCSVSLALRIAYGISGVVGEDEVVNQVTQPLSEGDGNGATIEVVELPPEVEEIIARARELGAVGWSNPQTWAYRKSMGHLDISMKDAIAHLDDLETKRKLNEAAAADEPEELRVLRSRRDYVASKEAVTDADREDKQELLDDIDRQIKEASETR